MNTADKLLTQIKEDREIRAKADTANILTREKYVAWLVWEKHALNSWERKNRQLEIAVAALNDIANRISVSGEDKDGGPDRVEISNDRNRRILDAKKALEEMESVK